MQSKSITHRWPLLVWVAVGAASLGMSEPLPAAQGAPRAGQAHTAGQFLRAVLRADYATAYARLAPEVRQGLSLPRFVAAARPLWRSGQHHGRSIELYKLGVRLGDGGASRLFYTFSYAADSSAKAPSELLEVTFRDTAARAVLGFELQAMTRNTQPALIRKAKK